MNEANIPQARIADLPATFEGSVVLLDVREHDEWQRGHGADARHIPMGEVPTRLDEIPRDGELYVVCKLGGRSQQVAQFLAQNGYRAINVDGGMFAWVQAGRPVITDGGGTGSV